VADKDSLEDLYRRFNRRSQAEGDPVSFLYRFDDPLEREAAALLAALLAYGRLAQIMKSVAEVLKRLGGRPRAFLLASSPQALREASAGFVHRVVKPDRLWRMLWAMKDVVERYGSLQACFLAHDDPTRPTVLPGLTGLVGCMAREGYAPGHLLPRPGKGSACKRLNLFMRWMVRRDEVDPGGWDVVSPARLIVPLDAHMWRVCRGLGLTQRRTCNLQAALEITGGFRALCPSDPVRYDFALMHASAAGELGPEGPSRPGSA
jgi:uncharacterized protein (TIGR02757 family)